MLMLLIAKVRARLISEQDPDLRRELVVPPPLAIRKVAPKIPKTAPDAPTVTRPGR